MKYKKTALVTVFLLLIISSVNCQELSDDEKAVLKEANQIMKDITNITGAQLTHDVKKGFKNKSELIKVLEQMMMKEYPKEKVYKEEKLLKFLGLISKDMNILESLKALLLEQIGGFYDPDTKELYLIRAGQMPLLDNPVVRRTIMAHELCHAVQDMQIDLNSMMNEEKVKNNDKVAAFQAVVEGQATVVMMQYLFKITPDKLPDFSVLRPYMAESGDLMGASFKEFKNAPLYFKERIALFPYLDGAVFYKNFILKFPDLKPVEIFNRLPKSSEQILHFDKYINEDNPFLINLNSADTLLDKEWKLLTEEIVGEIDWKIIFMEMGDGKRAAMDAEGWDGATLYLYEKIDTKDLCMALISTWDTEKDRDEAAENYKKILRVKYPDYSEIKSNDMSYCIKGKDSLCGLLKIKKDLIILEEIPIEKSDSVINKVMEFSAIEIKK